MPEETKKPTNVIIGCGSTGKYIAKELANKESGLVIIDIDQDRVEELRDEGFDAYQGEISEINEISEIDFSDVETFLVLTPDMEANKRAIEEIKQIKKDSTIIVRADDLKTEKDFQIIGADMVIHSSKMIADAAIREIQNLKTIKKSWDLYEKLKGGFGDLGIFVHSNPDPDAISGALGLKKIAESVGREAEIVYSGEIGHYENRAFVNLLGIELKKFEEVGGVEGYEQIALVDSAIPGQNNVLPQNTEIDIVIDHHNVSLDEITADFFDIRRDVGSSSTILTKYIQELDIKITEKLATALLFGIRTDTLEFKRNVNTADFTAASYLHQLADNELLREIESQAMEAETLNVLGEAIKNRKVTGSYLVSNIGESGNKDALPQAADYLIKLEGVSTAVVFGKIEQKVHVSARNNDARVDLGEVIREAYGEIGSAGGHKRMAGAQIPIEVFGAIEKKEVLLKLIKEGITNRFLSMVGA